MLRFPVYSLGLAAIGLIIGFLAGNETLGWRLAGGGSLLGYLAWIDVRVEAVQQGRRFHAGSVLNIFVCTSCALALAMAGFGWEKVVSPGLFWFIAIVSSLVVTGLHWQAALESGSGHVLPTAGDVAREVGRTVLADDPGSAAAKAIGQTLRDAARGDANRVGGQ